MEQEFSGEHGDVFEEALIPPVAEHESLVDSDKSLPDIGEHVLVDQRTGPSTSKRSSHSLNRATMVGRSIQPDSNASDKKKRPLYCTPGQGENESVLT